MDATNTKFRSAREMFKRSGNHYTMPFNDILNVILAKDATEGPMVDIPHREYDEEHAQNLAALIRQNGFNEESWPTFVFHQEKLYAYVGNHRTSALQMLARDGFDGIPNVKFTIVDMKTKSPEDHIISLWTSNLQKGLGMPDQAKVVHALYRISKDKSHVAKSLNITVQTVDNMLEYNNQVPDEIKQMVKEEKVSASTALSTFREEGRDSEAAKKRLADAFEAAIAEQAAKVAAKKVKKSEEAKKVKVTERHLKATRKVVSIPDEYASLLPNHGPNVEDLLAHLRDLTEVANRALKVLKTEASNGNMEADEVAFELDSLLEQGNRKGFTKAAEAITEEAAE
jgi:hypothetical protein